ncbi:TCP-1 chaperonin subunit alpha [Spironucleus salmonicida]|uniref:TCP-1 chaperonin subunit alpha n=1 Tax=Spironucleus salmonicida TaxID=348837 RepID=V6M1G6_9EUKA|nr:TCP-1 chaperonin subunit alpha [Spironucleus salmonicida]|eukprot:EST47029.1 TCP-1 chaperonin subunit alpha [Spironucleus salmonicida]
MSVVKNEIFLPGEWTTGKEVRDQNVNAAIALAGIVKTTLGPNGLDKMMVDDIGEITVTNDGATILSKLDVAHPAAKVLVELSNLQDKEVGDGTTSVVICAAEFLKQANEIIGKNMHSTTVMAGFQLALSRSINYIQKRLQVPVSQLSDEDLYSVAKTSMSSKIIGLSSDHFAKLCVDAIKNVKTELNGEIKYPVKSVGLLKAIGGSTKDTSLVNGFAVNVTRASMQMPTQIQNAKIALLDFNLQQQRLAVGTQILITDASKLEGVRDLEHEVSRKHIEMIINAGANVILTTGAIDDMASKYLVEANVMGCRRVTLEDMKKIAKVTNGTIVSALADLEGNESFSADLLGFAGEVSEQRLADDNIIFIKNTKGRNCGSILLRGPNTQIIDEIERSIHDALCAVSRTLESGNVVPGGGCVETALSVYLEEYAKTIEGKEQVAVSTFAKCLMIIPRQLSINSALDAVELVSQLKANHAISQRKETEQSIKDEMRHHGLDLKRGIVGNNLKAGVLEPVISKIKSLSFAVEAAVTILRIDDNIILNAEQKQQ